MSRTKMRAPGNGSAKKGKLRAERVAARATAAGGGKEQTGGGDVAVGDGDAGVLGGRKSKRKRGKKDKKDKKEGMNKAPQEETPEAEQIVQENEENPSTEDPTEHPTETPSKKRKHDPTASEIEIDVNLPEPPSKKTLRKLKKNPALADTLVKPSAAAAPKPKSDKPVEDFPEHSSQARSKWGIWIGNLSFSTTRPQLEEFLARPPSTIQRTEITRVNLPTDPRTKKNQGFAYVDFANEKALEYALTLTETLFQGRKALIKNSKDFSNRNGGTTPAGGVKLGPNLSSKPPSKTLFVGNLDFETKDEDLKRHFEFAGEIVKVRLATFEDTGKCKGFGFIDFEDIDSVKRAMLGLSEAEEETRNELEGKEEEELAKTQKKRRFIGPRQIKMEYGEDPSVRYKKRYGKDRPDREDGGGDAAGDAEGDAPPPRKRRAPKQDEDWAEKAWEQKRQKQDKRDINPGAAYSNDVRRTGAITESKGKKVKFDDV